ncbi:MAG: glycosyltransferase family 4 protein, partial [Bacteroidota bacterium]
HLEQFEHVFLNGEIVIPADKNLDAPSLETELSEYKPDLIIIYGYFQKLQRRAHRWAIANKIKLAYISDSELLHKRNKIKEFLMVFFIRRYFAKINYFLSVGDANEAFYRQYGVKHSQIIRMHFPIDVIQYESSYIQKNILRKKIRALFNIGDNEIISSVVGKLVSWKNQDHIIDALKVLEEESIYLNLFVIGSGEMMELWQQKAKTLKQSKVHFVGFINIEDLPAYYAASDMYIHPASIEPHSIGVSEAIYMGCPIIMSDRCGSYGTNDDVQDGKNGFVFEFGNIQDLAEKIKILCKDELTRITFGEYSHTISKKFQLRSHIETLNDLKIKCAF